ncbi:hypothetical protein ARMSODRAFT_476489 [Armillaria solidipes]|uniref:Uncharacterized protein n=1 Tax=Armillaria solidipes TaxID=1076256 RepID=A0A2H3BB10_9AGAR|nr:hypothetical protein ARMSODRAFT_476489 [Armillaria solidipes]
MESKVIVVREAEASGGRTVAKWCRGLKLALTATISLKATASIELEDIIKQPISQLNRKLAVEKERDQIHSLRPIFTLRQPWSE